MKRAAKLDPDFGVSKLLDAETPGWEYAKPELGEKLKDVSSCLYVHDVDSWEYILQHKHNCRIMPLEWLLKSKEEEGLIKQPKSFSEVFWMCEFYGRCLCIELNGKVDWNEWNW